MLKTILKLIKLPIMRVQAFNYLTILFCGLLLCQSCGSDDSGTDMEMEEEVESTASFKLEGEGYDDQFSYTGEDNLIFCRNVGGGQLWIRLARDKDANGDNSPHIDIDICNYEGTGTYQPMDPTVRPCGSGPLWNIYWHDGDRVYLNEATASPCTLELMEEGNIITGVFHCDGLVQFSDGEGALNIRNGSFKTTLQ